MLIFPKLINNQIIPHAFVYVTSQKRGRTITQSFISQSCVKRIITRLINQGLWLQSFLKKNQMKKLYKARNKTSMIHEFRQCVKPEAAHQRRGRLIPQESMEAHFCQTNNKIILWYYDLLWNKNYLKSHNYKILSHNYEIKNIIIKKVKRS